MNRTRRNFGIHILGAAATATLPSIGRAQQTARLVVPFTAAGPADVFGRLLAENGLGGSSGRRYVIDNKPGAGGTIGTAAVAKAAPDGMTLLFSSTAFVQSAAVFANPGYDPVHDFAPISQVATTTVLLTVRADHPARTLKDFIRIAKSKPATYASAGIGSPTHLYGHLLSAQAGLNMTHVPYKGEAPALTDLLGGQVDCGFLAPVTIGAHVSSGKLRTLATTGSRRPPLMPDVPTLRETGIEGFDSVGWFGLFGPTQMPAKLVADLAEDVRKAVKTPAAQRWLADNMIFPLESTPQSFAEVVARDAAYWKGLVKQANVTPN